MNCQRVRDQIKAYIDGELGLLERWRVARHLESCDACRQEEIAMTKLTQELSETEQTPAPEGLRDRVMSKLELEGSPGPIRRSWTASPAAQFAVLAVIVVVIGAVVFPFFARARRAGRVQGLGIEASSPMTPKSLSQSEDASTVIGGRVLLKQIPAAGSMPLMIIKTAEIKIDVKHFQPAYDQAVVIAGSVGGYVTNSSAQKSGDDGEYGTVTMRIPADSFERTLDRLGGLGRIATKTITGEDVTGEVVDLEARLRNKRAEERQYLEIMNRASKIQDIVTVSNELFRVRGEIEEAQGRVKYLKSAVAMSTINVGLNENGTRKPTGGPSLWNTVTDAGGSLLDTAKALARMLIWLVVYSPIWATPIVIWVLVRKRSR